MKQNSVLKKILSIVLTFAMLVGVSSVGLIGSASMSASSSLYEDFATYGKSDLVKNIGSYATTTTNGASVGSAYTRTTVITLDTYEDFVWMYNFMNATLALIECSSYYAAGEDTSATLANIYSDVYSGISSSGYFSTTELSTYNISTWLYYFLYFSGSTSASGTSDSGTKNSLYSSYYNYVQITTTDYVGYLESVDGTYEDVSADTCFTYEISGGMNRWYYGWKISSWKLKYYYYMSSEYAYSTTETTTLGEATYETVNSYASQLDAYNMDTTTFADLVEMLEEGTLQSYYDSLLDLIDEIIDYCGSTETYEKLYADYLDAIDDFLALMEAALAFESTLEIASQLNDFVTSYPDYGTYNYGAFDYETMVADYATYLSIYNQITAATDDDTYIDYLVDNDYLNYDYYLNFTDNVVVYDLAGIKEAVDALIATYEENDGTLSTGALSALYTQIQTYLDKIYTYSDQVIDSIFPDGYTYIEVVAAALECDLNIYVQFFTELSNTTLVTLGAETIVNAITNYSANLSGLEDFYDSIISEFEELGYTTEEATAIADELLSDLIVTAGELEDDLYEALYTLFAATTESLYEGWLELGAVTEFTNVADYLKFKALFNSVDYDYEEVYTLLTSYGYPIDSTIESEYQIIISVYLSINTFISTFGFAYYSQTEVESYGLREVYANDQVKEEDTTITEDELLEVIESLDNILTSDTMTSILGCTLEELVTETIEDLIFTDDMVNTIILLIYKSVADAFDDLWDDLDLVNTYSYFSQKFSYSIDLWITEITGSVTITFDIDFLYTTMQDLAAAYGLYIYPVTMAENTDIATDYPEVASILSMCGYAGWNSPYLYDDDGELLLDWGVDEADDREEAFYAALATALSGIEPLLNALLFGESYSQSSLKVAEGEIDDISDSTFLSLIGGALAGDLTAYLSLSATANDGYLNFIAPILEALGVDSSEIPSASTLESNSLEENIRAIFEPIIGVLEGIADAPISSILELLPTLTYVLNFDMLDDLVAMLASSITYDATWKASGDVLDWLDVDSGTLVSDTYDINLGDYIDINEYVDTSDGLNSLIEQLLGVDLDLDQASIATAGELVTRTTARISYIYDYSSLGLTYGYAYYIEADKADLFYIILEQIVDILADEEAMTALLSAFLDDDATAEVLEVISSLELNEADDVIIAITELFNTRTYDQDTFDYTVETGSATTLDESVTLVLDVLYTEYWTQDMAEYVADNLVDFFVDLLTLFGYYDLVDVIDGEITGLNIDTYIYSTSVIDYLLNFIADILVDVDLDSDIMTALLDSASVDIAGMLEFLSTYTYEEFEDGDSEGFATALKGLLVPLMPIIEIFLVSSEDGSSITLLDGEIVINGYNGYQYAILPILETLGCENLLTYSEFIALDDEGMVDAIIDPLMDVIDSICSDPLDTLFTILPTLLSFVNEGYLEDAIEVLLEPIYVVCDVIRPIYNIDITINLSLMEMANDLLADYDLMFSVDLEYLLTILLTFCTQVEYTTTDGETAIKYTLDIDALKDIDTSISADLLTYTLRCIVGYLQSGNNYSKTRQVMEGYGLMDPDQADLWDYIWAAVDVTSVDGTLFVFYYVFFGLNTAVQTLDEVGELVHDEIYDVLYKLGAIEGQDQLSDLIDNVNSFLNQILSDLGVDEDEDGALSFFQKIIDFFYKFWKWIQSIFFVEW